MIARMMINVTKFCLDCDKDDGKAFAIMMAKLLPL